MGSQTIEAIKNPCQCRGALVNKQAWKSFLEFVISSEETPQQRDTIERIYILQGSRADSVEVCRQPQVEQGSHPHLTQQVCCPEPE